MTEQQAQTPIQCQSCGFITLVDGYKIPDGWKAETNGLWYCDECTEWRKQAATLPVVSKTETPDAPIPTGCIYAIENWGGDECAVARYIEDKPGHYVPDWQNIDRAEYSCIAGNMADFESADQPCASMRFYDLQAQQDAIAGMMAEMAELADVRQTQDDASPRAQ